MKITASLFLLCALAVPTAAAAPSTANSPAEQRSLEIEISETAAGKTATPVRLLLPLVVDAAPAEMRVREGATFYHVIALARRPRGGSVIIDLTIERRDGSDGSPRDFEIKAQTLPAQGKRSTLAAAERPDGSRMEVTLVLQ